jgi:hypothetical protein
VEKISNDRLISSVKKAFEKARSKFCKKDEMLPLLVQEGLSPQEAEQAISLAIRDELIRMCYAYTDEIDGEPCYELLTDEDREFSEELHQEFLKKRWP